MIRARTGILLAVLLAASLQGAAFADTDGGIFPAWVRQTVSLWVDGQISDPEFLALVRHVLDQGILPDKTESHGIMADAAKIVIRDNPGMYGKTSPEVIPHWAKDRAEWWLDGKIDDMQFLGTVHYLGEAGYLEHNPPKNTGDEFHSDLERYMLDDEEVLRVTKETKWRIFSTQYEFAENATDSVRTTFNDITRVYEPIFYKFKVPTLTMEIYEFDSDANLNDYWSFEGRDRAQIFDSAYLTGHPNANSECLFNYTPQGALTSCIYENLVIHVIIFDQHAEHYDYRADTLTLDGDEPTARFMGEILKKIAYYRNDSVVPHLHSAMYGDMPEPAPQEDVPSIQTVPKSTEPERSAVQGVENFSCVRDDFGLVTVSGQYYNDGIKRPQVYLEISFLDAGGSEVGRTGTTLVDLVEFESKRFVGHSKWDGIFASCQIEIR